MGTFLLIVFLLITLLILIVIGSVQDLTLWCTTKQKHEFVIMILPALLSLISLIVIIVTTYLVLDVFNINTLNLIFTMIMKFNYNPHNYIIMVSTYIFSLILFICLQALCLKLININYRKIYNYIKDKIKSINKNNSKKHKKLEETDKTITKSINTEHTENGSNLPTVLEEKQKLPFFYAFSASLFAFAICFFSSLLLFYIGTLIGKSYII